MVTAVDLLATVEDVASHDSGALVVDSGNGPFGSVFAESGRVCWAATVRQGRRLRDLLSRFSGRPIDSAELDRVFDWCRVNGRPLGETLVERRMFSEDAMRAALRQHTIESLMRLCSLPAGHATWVRHRNRGYRATFTMAPVELLAAVGAYELEAEDLEHAEVGLSEVPLAGAAASYLVGSGEPVVVHTAGSERLRVRMVVAMGTWAAAAFAVCNGFSAGALSRGVEGASGAVALGWRSSRRVVHATVIEDRDALAATITALERRRYPAVMARPVEMH